MSTVNKAGYFGNSFAEWKEKLQLERERERKDASSLSKLLPGSAFGFYRFLSCLFGP
jgi:hypothetical protein